MFEINACDFVIDVNTNRGKKAFKLSLPLKEKQVKKYVDELNKYQVAKFHIHPTFNCSISEIPDEIEFNLFEDEEVIKIIPIVKDRVKISPDTKYKLGIVTTVIKTVSKSS